MLSGLNVLKIQKEATVQASKLHLTGRGALNQDIPCQEACGTCQTGHLTNPTLFHPKDKAVLEKAREKKGRNKANTEAKGVDPGNVLP